MTAALYDLQLQLSPPLPSSFASINTDQPRFTWKMAVKTEREREIIILIIRLRLDCDLTVLRPFDDLRHDRT